MNYVPELVDLDRLKAALPGEIFSFIAQGGVNFLTRVTRVDLETQAGPGGGVRGTYDPDSRSSNPNDLAGAREGLWYWSQIIEGSIHLWHPSRDGITPDLPEPEDESLVAGTGLLVDGEATGDLPPVEARLRRDIEIIGQRLLAEAVERGWCSDFDDFVAEVNKDLSESKLPARAVRYTVRFDIELPVTNEPFVEGYVFGPMFDAIRDDLGEGQGVAISNYHITEIPQ